MSPTPLNMVLLILTGGIAGFVNVMAGGGSLLTLPVLLMTGLPAPIANGSNRIAILLQNISATAGFMRKGYSELKLSLSLTLCALPGAIAGAYAGTKLEGQHFKYVLAGVMIVVMVLMALKRKGGPAKETTQARNLVAGHILMFGAGIYGGFIQAGVGFIFMFILHKVMGLDLVRVNMHKVFIVGCYTIVALIVFTLQGKVNWLAGGVLAIGNVVGAWIGARTAIKKGDRLIRWILNIVLLIFIIKLLLG